MFKYYVITYIILSKSLIADVNNYIDKINYLIDNGKYIEANSEYLVSIKQYDANALLYFTGANVAKKLDKLDDANRRYIKAIELDNKIEEYRVEQEKLSLLKDAMSKARKTFDNGLISDAIIEYEKIITDHPNHAIIYYNLGHVYKINLEYDLAVNNYYKAIELNPFENKYSKAINAIAQGMAKDGDTEYRRQEFQAAIEKYKKAIDYNPDYTTAYFKLARTYLIMKDYENTRLVLEQNLAIDPQQEQSEKMLGDIYRDAGDFGAAIEHYNKSISINFGLDPIL